MSSWNSQYQGQSIGKILHFLYYYCGFDVAELCTVGKEVKYHGKTIASKITWEVEKVTLSNGDVIEVDVPVFTFTDTSYIEQQNSENKKKALDDLNVVFKDRYFGKRVEVDSFWKRY